MTVGSTGWQLSNPDSIWHFDLYEDDIQMYNGGEEVDRHDDRPQACRLPVVDREKLNMTFDGPGRSFDDRGPSPALILEACTLACTGEGFDMERLETIGDSFLKLAVSIYAFGETVSRSSGEGQLTKMRTKQISNRNLYRLGKQRGIDSYIARYMFDLKNNFLAPFTKVSECEGVNARVQQSISDKNIADCVEALIGAYLKVCGSKGANKVLKWFGLDIVPDRGVVAFNADNGFPVFAVPVFNEAYPDRCRMEEDLFSLLVSFEECIGYRFQNRLLLIEAFSHATYTANRITNCYQRLEFLGDAVLGKFPCF